MPCVSWPRSPTTRGTLRTTTARSRLPRSTQPSARILPTCVAGHDAEIAGLGFIADGIERACVPPVFAQALRRRS